jgi:hypothetical protein
MRTLKEYALTNSIKCTLFSWNGKYLIKLENGHLEQTYKISELDILSLSELEKQIETSEFQQKAESIFNNMEENLDHLLS